MRAKRSNSSYDAEKLDCFVAALLAMTKFLRRGLQPLQRYYDVGLSRPRGLALFFLFLDDLFLRVGDEFLVGEFCIDPLDVGVGLAEFFLEARPLRGEINHHRKSEK